MSNMFERLADIDRRYEELTQLMSQPEIATNPEKSLEFARERADLDPTVQAYRELKDIEAQIAEAETMLKDEDAEMAAMAKDELDRLRDEREPIVSRLRALLVPKDPLDEKNVILEDPRRAPAATKRRCSPPSCSACTPATPSARAGRPRCIDFSETGIGGVKEVIIEVRGRGAYSHLRFESGVHRVQRVPVTESSGRIHTSAATVAVMPEAEEVDVQIADNDLRIDVYRSSGHGGQRVNTTDSRRAHHAPADRAWS